MVPPMLESLAENQRDVEVARSVAVCCQRLAAFPGNRAALEPAIPALRGALARYASDAVLAYLCEELFRMHGAM